MASNQTDLANAQAVSAQVIIGCSREVAERISILPANQTLHLLPSLPPSFHTTSTNTPDPKTPNNNPNDNVFFALPPQPLRTDRGYVFSSSETAADFQLPNEVPVTTYTTDFRIVVKKDSECILVDESITGITVNETKLHSMENQKVIAAAGYYLSKPKCEMMLLPERPNLVQIGWNGLKLTLYVPGDPERTVQGVNTGQLSAPGRGDGWLRWGGFSEDWCFMAGFRQRKVRRKRDSLLRAMDSYW